MINKETLDRLDRITEKTAKRLTTVQQREKRRKKIHEIQKQLALSMGAEQWQAEKKRLEQFIEDIDNIKKSC